MANGLPINLAVRCHYCRFFYAVSPFTDSSAPCPQCKSTAQKELINAGDFPTPSPGCVYSDRLDASNRPDEGAQVARRDPSGVRYDILYAAFEEMMAKIGYYGSTHYGDFNWQKSRLTGDKGPVNHMQKHLNLYKQQKPYDHPEVGEGHKIHLAAIAFNAMMEFWYEEHPECQ